MGGSFHCERHFSSCTGAKMESFNIKNGSGAHVLNKNGLWL